MHVHLSPHYFLLATTPQTTRSRRPSRCSTAPPRSSRARRSGERTPSTCWFGSAAAAAGSARAALERQRRTCDGGPDRQGGRVAVGAPGGRQSRGCDAHLDGDPARGGRVRRGGRPRLDQCPRPARPRHPRSSGARAHRLHPPPTETRRSMSRPSAITPTSFRCPRRAPIGSPQAEGPGRWARTALVASSRSISVTASRGFRPPSRRRTWPS